MSFFFESLYASYIYLQFFFLSVFFILFFFIFCFSFFLVACLFFHVYVFSMRTGLAQKRIRFPQGLSLVLYLYSHIDILTAFENGDRKIMQSIKVTSRFS